MNSEFSCKIAIVAGPYVYNSLDTVSELNCKLKSEVNPDYAIFFGPFAPAESPMLNAQDCEYTAGELTDHVIDILSQGLRCVMIPSVDDDLALPLMPHPRLSMYSGAAMINGDPCFITLGDEMNIMATSYEIPFAILSQFDGAGTNRMQECLVQIAHQNSACPVLDPIVQVQYIGSLVPPKCPHLICCPTRMKPDFAKIDDTNVVIVPRYMNNSTIRGYAAVSINGNEMEVSFMK